MYWKVPGGKRVGVSGQGYEGADEGSEVVRRISYLVLDVEELGSVYGDLLEYEAQVVAEGERMRGVEPAEVLRRWKGEG